MALRLGWSSGSGEMQDEQALFFHASRRRRNILDNSMAASFEARPWAQPGEKEMEFCRVWV